MSSEQDKANPPPERKLISHWFFTVFSVSSQRFTFVHFAWVESPGGQETALLITPSSGAGV
jgi:hypothetical protein